MRHDPAWLRLHDGHAHGVLADDPVHVHSGSEPSAGHTDQQNHHRPHSDAAQSHADPARTDTSGSASLTRPNHPKAALPIDQRVGPAGSCTGGFRMQAPENLHKIRRPAPALDMAAHAKSCRSTRTRLFRRGRSSRTAACGYSASTVTPVSERLSWRKCPGYTPTAATATPFLGPGAHLSELRRTSAAEARENTGRAANHRNGKPRLRHLSRPPRPKSTLGSPSRHQSG